MILVSSAVSDGTDNITIREVAGSKAIDHDHDS